MGGHGQGDTILEFDLPAMGAGTNTSSWPRVLPTRTIQPWWPTSMAGASDIYTNGLVWWQNKLWVAPRAFYALDPASTAPLKIYAQDGQVMTFSGLTMQKFSGFVKRGPGLDPLLGCGGYESGQGSQSGPSLATLTGQKLIEYQWPADPGPVINGVPANWNLRAPRDTNYSVNDPGHEWIGWTPRLVNGVLEGRWTWDRIFSGGLVLPDGIYYWPYMATGPIAYADQGFRTPVTYAYRYDPSTYRFLDFAHAAGFGDGPVLGQELGPDGKMYLAHGGRGASSLFSGQDIELMVFG
jgi:hypothetical protein